MMQRRRQTLGVLLLLLAMASGSGNALASPAAVAPNQPFPDQNAAFLGCFTGISAGALISGLPPVSGWIPYAGWHIGVPSMVMRMALGCYTGLIGAELWTAGQMAGQAVGGWWRDRGAH